MSTVDLNPVRSGPLPYLLSMPDRPHDAAPDGWPVLFFLHGFEEGPPTDMYEAVTRHGPLSDHVRDDAVSEFVIVAPQLPERGDLWLRFADAVRETVAQVTMLHRVDVTRLYLTGFSYGASGVFDLALAQPDLWAALWAVDPTRVPSADPARPVWISAGSVARPGRDALVKRLGLEELNGESPGDRIWADDGEDHVGSATRAYADDRVYHWLLEHRL